MPTPLSNSPASSRCRRTCPFSPPPTNLQGCFNTHGKKAAAAAAGSVRNGGKASAGKCVRWGSICWCGLGGGVRLGGAVWVRAGEWARSVGQERVVGRGPRCSSSVALLSLRRLYPCAGRAPPPPLAPPHSSGCEECKLLPASQLCGEVMRGAARLTNRIDECQA